MREARHTGSPELRVLADLMAQGIYDEKLRSSITQMFVQNREEVHQHLARGFEELGLKPRVPLEVIPRLVLGMLDGLALHDFFDPMTGEDDAVMAALESIALSLFEA
jgi:hypothetical protein